MPKMAKAYLLHSKLIKFLQIDLNSLKSYGYYFVASKQNAFVSIFLLTLGRKEQRLARGAKQVTKYRHLVAGYSKQLNSLTDQYGTSNALMSTLKPEGEKPVHDVVNKINQLNLKVLQVPADAPKKDQLDDEMKKLTETAQHWSDASTH